MYESVEIKRIAALSLLKLLWIGCTIFSVLFFSLMGIFAGFGASTMQVNGEQVTGLTAVIIGPIFGVFFGLCMTWICWCACTIGLWIFSRFENISIKVEFSRKIP